MRTQPWVLLMFIAHVKDLPWRKPGLKLTYSRARPDSQGSFQTIVPLTPCNHSCSFSQDSITVPPLAPTRGDGHPERCWLDHVGRLSGTTVHCLSSHVTESMKTNMASAAVMSNLLPTIPSLAGSSVVETGLSVHRQPSLVLFLTILKLCIPYFAGMPLTLSFLSPCV